MNVNIRQTFARMLLAALLLISPVGAQESDSSSKSTPRPPSPQADSSEVDEESSASSARSTSKSTRSSNDENDGTSGIGSTSGSRTTPRHTGSDDRTGRIGSPSGNSRAGSDGTGPSGAGSRSTPGTSSGGAASGSAAKSTSGGRTSRDDDDEEGTSGTGSSSGTRTTTRHTGSDERTGRIGSPSGTSRAGSDGTGPGGAGSRSTSSTSRGNARGSRDTARSFDEDADDSRGSRSSNRSGSRAGIGRSDSDYSSGNERSRTDDRSSRESDVSRDRSSRSDDQNPSSTRSEEDLPRERLRDEVRDTARDVRDTVRDARGVARSVRDNVSRETRTGRQDFDADTARPADIGLWFNRSTSDGLIIRDISNSGPIAQLGFREQDQIVSIDGNRVKSEREFMQYLFQQENLTQRLSVVIDRKGAQRTIFVEPSALIEHSTTVQADPLETLGLVLDDRHADRLTVWKVIPRSSAYYAGVRSGDVITTWDNKRLTSKADMELSLQNASEGEEVHLTVYRGQEPRQIEVEIPRLASSADSSGDRRTSYRPRIDSEARDTDSTLKENRPLRSKIPGVVPRNR